MVEVKVKSKFIQVEVCSKFEVQTCLQTAFLFEALATVAVPSELIDVFSHLQGLATCD